MLISDLKEYNLPQLSITDKAGFALITMEDYDIFHLPVVDDKQYLGLISKEDLLDADEEASIGSLSSKLLKVSLRDDQHFFFALKLFNQYELSLLPVVSEQNEVESVITTKGMIKGAAEFLNADTPGGIIILEMDSRNFSSGEINRLVETNDASITQLNSHIEPGTGLLVVTIKINKTEVSDVVATLQRYEYNVRNYFGEELFKNELKENYDLLMTYLNI